MQNPFIHFIITSGGLFSLILAAGDLIEEKKGYGTYLQAILKLCVSVWLIYDGLLNTGYISVVPWLGFTNLAFVYSTAPVLYFLMSNIFNREYTYQNSHLIHFLPVIIISAFCVPFQFENTELQRTILSEFFNFIHTDDKVLYYRYLNLVITLASTVLMIIYLLIVTIKNRQFLSGKHYRINYFFVLIAVITFISLIGSVSAALGCVLSVLDPPNWRLYTSVILEWSPFLAVIDIYILYLLGKRYQYFLEIIQTKIDKIRYMKSKITSLDVDEVLKQLEVLMKEERIYADTNITLNTLASKLSIASHQLSQILNERLNKNFNTYINEYRINEAKELIKNDQDIAIISIAYNVGFNSLSTFYHWFIKYTDFTPMAFRERHQEKTIK
jgi:AraC-like DNA-binding protein